MTILPYTTKSKFIFDLRGEMAATLTNEVSSLSQAHFDEILVLVEFAANFYYWICLFKLVLILVLVEHDSKMVLNIGNCNAVLILVLMEDNSQRPRRYECHQEVLILVLVEDNSR